MSKGIRVDVDDEDGHVTVWNGSVGLDVTTLVEEALREDGLTDLPGGKIVVSWVIS